MGKIYVIGIGPGDSRMMTMQAKEALEQSDVIAGYKTYTDLIREAYPGKEFFENGMKGEVERCLACIRFAKAGKTVALICSGDAGVYGMASPLLTIAQQEEFDDIEIIPGITAALSGAAALGAPLGHDFCVISLSDLLTPWEQIEKRLLCAAEGDFCIAIYNPASHKRADYLKRSCDILLTRLSPETACGYVRNIGRDETEKKVCSLQELAGQKVDMFTTVFIGNSKTRIIGGRLITPRGYNFQQRIQSPAESAASGGSQPRTVESAYAPCAVRQEHQGVLEYMRKIAVFSGTTEGRELSSLLSDRAVSHIVFVAGEYGREMMQPDPYAMVHVGRMNEEEMRAYLESEGFGAGDLVIDATHPYAAEVTGNIRRAADALGCTYRRVIRERGNLSADGKDGSALYTDMAGCAAALEHTQGNILLTTGSKELSAYCARVSEETRQRTYVRVLPAVESIRLCADAGIRSDHIIAMQGPFSREMNLALMRQYDIRHLVTKESGSKGGFQEKVEAAAQAGAKVYVIARPMAEEGWDVQSVLREILGEDEAGGALSKEEAYSRAGVASQLTGQQRETRDSSKPQHAGRQSENQDISGLHHTGRHPEFHDHEELQITLVGLGMGDETCRTVAVNEAIRDADIVFGFERLIRDIPARKKYNMYRAAQVIPVLEREKPQRAVIVFSGDTGFYSGARAMLNALREWNADAQIRVLPGISSFSYLSAKLQEGYEDTLLRSLHGKNNEEAVGALAEEIRYHARVFVLLSGAADIRAVAAQLIERGINAQICAGIDLSYTSERIDRMSLQQALTYDAEGIPSMLIINPAPERRPLIPVRKDAEFDRARIPMTKECVRHESIVRLGLREGDVVYDIGGGTGSVAIEAASMHPSLQVFSIERKHEAAELIRENIRKLRTGNVTVIEGDALEELVQLPDPDCVFIGGSGGTLSKIMAYLTEKKSGIRYVITAVSLETMEEVRRILQKFEPAEQSEVLLSVSDIQKTGAYHMLHAQNPVAIFSFVI